MLSNRVRATGLFGACLLLSSAALAQPNCSANSTTLPTHIEGLAERVGDITVSCTGGTAGSTVSLSVFVTLNTNVTNRTDTGGNVLGITLAGASGMVRLTSATTLNISPLNYTVPVVPATPVTITISGIRAAIATSANGSATPFITASVVGIGASFPPLISLTVASSFTTLLASTLSNGVPCNGSPLPANNTDFAAFLAVATNYSTVRITEASPSAFTLINAGADTGLRIRVNLSGYGSTARIFAPDFIVGNSGTIPTSAGAFGATAAGGTYTPASGQLLLGRITGVSASGAGGSLVRAKPAIAGALADVSEISMSGGAGVIVYEVLDGNLLVSESAQVPVFVTVPQTSCPSTLSPQLAITAAPVSTVNTSTSTDAIPRFVATVPATDCQQFGDCNANYFPKLLVDATPLTLSGTSKGALQTANIRVGNAGGGILSFTTSIVYDNGSGWLSLSPSSGINNVTVQAIADPTNLPQGTYTATIKVDAGAFGSATVPVTFTVGAVGVVIQNVGNAASFQYGTVAPGSYAVLFGLNMAGTNVSVTVNSLPATIIYKSATQINFIVPNNLGAPQFANVVVTVDGQASGPFRVNSVANAPGIFTPGIVNFADGFINDAAHPAARGAFIIVFFTGLAIPVAPGTITVNIGSQTNLIPAFAGPQGLPALDQVNITVPSSLPPGTSPVPIQVCAPGSTGQQTCSNQVNLYIQ
jgi:uncharacterized protein (TIGR03437 family)